MRIIVIFLLGLSLFAKPLFSSTASCRWNVVTTYFDGVPVEPGVTVTYRIYRAFNPNLSDAVLLGATTALQYIDTTAPRKRTCYYFARAVVNGRESANSTVRSFYTNKP